MEELRAKSSAAEVLIEELMEENEELKKEMRIMVDEMDELQDNFRFKLDHYFKNEISTAFFYIGKIK